MLSYPTVYWVILYLFFTLVCEMVSISFFVYFCTFLRVIVIPSRIILVLLFRDVWVIVSDFKILFMVQECSYACWTLRVGNDSPYVLSYR